MGAGDAMPAVKCKQCGKEWTNVSDFMKGRGCASNDCPHTKPLREVPKEGAYLDISYRTEGEVISYYESTKPALFIDVPKVIALEIFPPGCRAKRKKQRG